MAAAGLHLAQERQAPPSACKDITTMASYVLINASVGALAGHLFSVISPVGGAIFGASSTVAAHIIDKALTMLGCEENLVTKITKFAVTMLASLVIATAVTSAFIATPVSLTSAAVILIAMEVVGIGIPCLECCCCCIPLGLVAGASAEMTVQGGVRREELHVERRITRTEAEAATGGAIDWTDRMFADRNPARGIRREEADAATDRALGWLERTLAEPNGLDGREAEGRRYMTEALEALDRYTATFP